MYFDGSVIAPGSGAIVVLISPDGSRLPYMICYHFLASNTMEYEALINALCIAIELGATLLYVHGDLELVVDQVMKESSCKSPLMAAYHQEVRKLENKFRGIKLHHVPLKDNTAADFLAKLVARREPPIDGVFINDLHEPSTRIREDPTQTRSNTNLALGGFDSPTCPDLDQVLEGSDLGASMAMSPGDITMMALDLVDWRAPLLAYLLKEVLPPERTEARRIARHAKTFIAIDDKLYKRSPLGVLMKCIPTD